MADPIHLGVNELGIPVYEIEEGGTRPMLEDDTGRTTCGWCRKKAHPMRISLAPDTNSDVEWVLLCCPECHAHKPHCIMRVKLKRKHRAITGEARVVGPDLTAIHPDPHHEIEVEPPTRFIPNGRGGEIEIVDQGGGCGYLRSDQIKSGEIEIRSKPYTESGEAHD